MPDWTESRKTKRMDAHPIRAADGSRMMCRGLKVVGGVAFLLLSAVIWFAPGAEGGVVHGSVSAVSLVTGVLCLAASRRPETPTVEIDTLSHEVRLVRQSRNHRTVLDRCQFSELSRVENSDTHVQLWGKKGTLLAEVAAADRLSHRNLVTALRVAGKL